MVGSYSRGSRVLTVHFLAGLVYCLVAAEGQRVAQAMDGKKPGTSRLGVPRPGPQNFLTLPGAAHTSTVRPTILVPPRRSKSALNISGHEKSSEVVPVRNSHSEGVSPEFAGDKPLMVPTWRVTVADNSVPLVADKNQLQLSQSMGVLTIDDQPVLLRDKKSGAGHNRSPSWEPGAARGGRRTPEGRPRSQPELQSGPRSPIRSRPQFEVAGGEHYREFYQSVQPWEITPVESLWWALNDFKNLGVYDQAGFWQRFVWGVMVWVVNKSWSNDVDDHLTIQEQDLIPPEFVGEYTLKEHQEWQFPSLNNPPLFQRFLNNLITIEKTIDQVHIHEACVWKEEAEQFLGCIKVYIHGLFGQTVLTSLDGRDKQDSALTVSSTIRLTKTVMDCFSGYLKKMQERLRDTSVAGYYQNLAETTDGLSTILSLGRKPYELKVLFILVMQQLSLLKDWPDGSDADYQPVLGAMTDALRKPFYMGTPVREVEQRCGNFYGLPLLQNQLGHRGYYHLLYYASQLLARTENGLIPLSAKAASYPWTADLSLVSLNSAAPEASEGRVWGVHADKLMVAFMNKNTRVLSERCHEVEVLMKRLFYYLFSFRAHSRDVVEIMHVVTLMADALQLLENTVNSGDTAAKREKKAAWIEPAIKGIAGQMNTLAAYLATMFEAVERGEDFQQLDKLGANNATYRLCFALSQYLEVEDIQELSSVFNNNSVDGGNSSGLARPTH